ncbi:MAG TPA: PHP domain-containing protein [Elusimicrobiales bacterium]|nr:PHP domain-containing protein [Elusimicrobiales bacterium]
MALLNLHLHSNYSDGSLTPSGLADAVVKAGIGWVSLTDHDICAGWSELEPRLRERGVRYLRGVEVSTSVHDNLHILGYGLDVGNKVLSDRLAVFRSRRVERVKKIIALLKEQGVDISFEELNVEADHCCGRPHIADLMKKRGLVRTRQKAFEKYIAYGRPAYVPPCGPGIEEAIRTIKDAGGITVLAHPGVVYDILELGKWKEMGLDGIEAFYPAHTGVRTREFLSMARAHGLLVTAGTDYHGPDTGRGELFGYEWHDEFFGPLKELFV